MPHFKSTAALHPDTYFEAKQMSANYQKAKEVLFERLQAHGLGTWVKKPTELEFFS
jgi:hypothetical protein